MNSTIEIYSNRAELFAEQYEQVTFDSVHRSWLHLIPSKGIVLDIGAGSGRDAAYFAKRGLDVVAVEPAHNLRVWAKTNHDNDNILWIDDTLPYLNATNKLSNTYELILLSAVWMHLEESERPAALAKLVPLLSERGLLVITLRHGASPDERDMFTVSRSEITRIIRSENAPLIEIPISFKGDDALGRHEINWETVIFKKESKLEHK